MDVTEHLSSREQLLGSSGVDRGLAALLFSGAFNVHWAKANGMTGIKMLWLCWCDTDCMKWKFRHYITN